MTLLSWTIVTVLAFLLGWMVGARWINKRWEEAMRTNGLDLPGGKP